MDLQRSKNLFAQRYRVVLLGDDDRFTHALGELLQSAGHPVVVTTSAPDALDELERSGRKVLLCDLAALQMQGVEALVTLRARRQTVPTVAISSMPNVAQHCAALGVKHHLEQPFRLGQLLDLLDLAVRPAPSRPVVRSSGSLFAD